MRGVLDKPATSILGFNLYVVAFQENSFFVYLIKQN